jgi:hypothetical protein
VYFTDRGLDELEDLRADDQVALEWLVARMREFIDLHPEYEAAIDRLAAHLARADDDELPIEDDGTGTDDEE